MTQLIETLENRLDDFFCKKLPLQLNESSRRTIVDYLPWANLLLAFLTLYSAFRLWAWSHATKNSIAYLNQLRQEVGGTTIIEHRLSLIVWISLLVLMVEALLFLMASSQTRRRQKKGWNLLFYALLVNVAYGIIITLSAYDGGDRLIASLFTSLVGLYFLFQIRSYYTGRKSVASRASSS